MNLFDKIAESLYRCHEEFAIIENYLSQTALSRGWTLGEFCSWLEDNFGEEQ